MNNNERWLKNYELAKKYYEHHGNLKILQKFKTKDGYTYDEDGFNLGIWIYYQRQNYKNNKLDENKILLLNKIGMIYSIRNVDYTWEEMYEFAKKYFDKYNNLNIPVRFRTKDGFTYNDDGINLGMWLYTQRQYYKKGKLDENKILLLNKIGMIYSIRNVKLTWEEWYELAKKYYEYHGNLEIPQRFKTKNGYSFDENGINLGNWIKNQRDFYNQGKLSTERILLLKHLRINFNNMKNKKSWEELYNLVKIYYEHHGNLLIPQNFKTKDGYTYDENGINLGCWLSLQRHNCKNGILSKDKKKLLDDIEFQVNVYMSWEEWYNLAKIYYEYHGNLEIPSEFRTTDGYTYDENGIKLGQWIFAQRRRVKQDSKRAKELEKIGMRFDKKRNKYSWEEWYNLAKIYYETYSNLLIPQNFKTKDGYTYDEVGIMLGSWINTQRQNYKNNKITKDKIYLLEQIGMIWDVRKNDNSIKMICSQYSIDYSMNKDILSHISIQEFEFKINYLINNNISLINEDGSIHEIFNMSSVAIKEKYNISLEGILENINNLKIKEKNKN